MNNKITIRRYLVLILTIIMMFTLTGINTGAIEPALTPPLELNLPTGGVNPIEVFGTEVDANRETEEPAVIATPHNPRLRSYVAPSIPGYSSYGYQWLTTTSHLYVAANRAALVGLYEAFTQYCELAYYSIDDISALGAINVTALNIPTNSPTALDEASKLISLAASVFDADNPQYYFISNGYYYNYYGGAAGTMYTVRPTFHTSYSSYAARQNNNAIITDKFAEYEVLVSDVNTPYDKARSVHDKMITERDYAYINNAPDSSDYAHSIMGVMDTTTNGPVCDSYAKAYSYIMNRLGIDTLYFTGLGNGGGHAWNMVKLNGIWYYCDTTWDDRETTNSDPGNMTNDFYCMYYMVGSNNTTFTSTHDVGDPEGSNSWFSYEEPLVSATDLDVDLHEYSYVTDNAYYANATWSNGGSYDVKDNYHVCYVDYFDYTRYEGRDFGTYTLSPIGNRQAISGVDLYLYVYPSGQRLGQLEDGADYKVVVKDPQIGLNRAWVYGIGDTFRGIDFGWVTLQ